MSTSTMRPGSKVETTVRPRVVLRADADSRTGYGHFVRTVALAAYLHGDFDCVVATRNADLGHPSDWQESLAVESGTHLMPLGGSDLAEFDARFADSLLHDDLVVLDNYYFSTDYQLALKRRVKALVCIDDMHDRHFVADAVLTVSPLTQADFSLEDYTRFLGGVDYAFLREPFFAPQSERVARTAPRRVVLAMGGADPLHLTDMGIRSLRRILPGVEIDVIAGQSVSVGVYEGVKIWRQADAARIVEIFDLADLGIFPASTVCVEAFARRLPVAAGYYVDNQKDFYEKGVADGWFAPLGWLPDGEEAFGTRLRAVLDHPLPSPPAFDFNARRGEIVDVFKELAM